MFTKISSIIGDYFLMVGESFLLVAIGEKDTYTVLDENAFKLFMEIGR